MEKLERDGMVAVLISPGFGAGWSTWSYGTDSEVLLYDPEIVQAVLDGDKVRAVALATQKAPDAYLGGAEQLIVEWVPKGTAFEVNEYDGSESLHILGDRSYHIA